ncbi:MAG: hypothetical protein IRZ26_03040 [Clostridia bacterium]|nr:hypothetical protein [Clostridia bacterium]
MAARLRKPLGWRVWTGRKRLALLLAGVCLAGALGAAVWRTAWRGGTGHPSPVTFFVLRTATGSQFVTRLYLRSVEPMREVRLAWTGVCSNEEITISGQDLGRSLTRDIRSDPISVRQLKESGPAPCAGREDLVITAWTRSGKKYVIHDSNIPVYMLPD